jgi:hypothetical protein
VDDGAITTTPGVGRCPACEGRTAASPAPCPACGGRYRLDARAARPWVSLPEADPVVEAAWWALAAASFAPVMLVLFTTRDFSGVLLALLALALMRATRMAWRGPTYPEMPPAPYLALAVIASYGMYFGIAVVSAIVLPFVLPATSAGVWGWAGLNFALHLLLWPRRRKQVRPARPPGDPEN